MKIAEVYEINVKPHFKGGYVFDQLTVYSDGTGTIQTECLSDDVPGIYSAVNPTFERLSVGEVKQYIRGNTAEIRN